MVGLKTVTTAARLFASGRKWRAYNAKPKILPTDLMCILHTLRMHATAVRYYRLYRGTTIPVRVRRLSVLKVSAMLFPSLEELYIPTKH